MDPNDVLFRLIVIKYADHGLAQTGGLASSLFNRLYILLTAFWSINAFFLNLFRLRGQMKRTFKEEEFLDLIPLGPSTFFSIPMAALFLLTFITLMMSYNVQYLKNHNADLRKEIQRNVVTFHVNFYFFLPFSILTLISVLLRSVTIDQEISWIKCLIVFVEFIKVICVGFLRPLVIIFMLKKKMPNFFEDSEEMQEIPFFMSRLSVEPRQEIMSPYKPFTQNARWGGRKEQSGTNAENASLNVRNQLQIHMNSMPDIDI